MTSSVCSMEVVTCDTSWQHCGMRPNTSGLRVLMSTMIVSALLFTLYHPFHSQHIIMHTSTHNYITSGDARYFLNYWYSFLARPAVLHAFLLGLPLFPRNIYIHIAIYLNVTLNACCRCKQLFYYPICGQNEQIKVQFELKRWALKNF